MLDKVVDNVIGNLGKKKLNFGLLLTEDILPKLESKATSSIIDSFERKISWWGAVRAGNGFTVFIWNEGMDDIIRIIKSLENSSILVDGVTKTLKNEIKKQECGFLGAVLVPITTELIKPVASSLVNGTFGKEVMTARRVYTNMDHMDKNF